MTMKGPEDYRTLRRWRGMEGKQATPDGMDVRFFFCVCVCVCVCVFFGNRMGMA